MDSSHQEEDIKFKTTPDKDQLTTSPRTSAVMRVKWDEDVIAEHDLERGTRQVIDEPKTPYWGPASSVSSVSINSDVGSDCSLTETTGPHVNEDAHCAVALVNDPVAAVISPKNQEDFMNEFKAAMDAEVKRINNKSEFAKRRKAHYNEFLAVKAMRRRRAPGNNDDFSSSSSSSDEN